MFVVVGIYVIDVIVVTNVIVNVVNVVDFKWCPSTLHIYIPIHL